MRRRIGRQALAAALATSAALAAHAEPAGTVDAAPHVEACSACHGVHGVSANPTVPNLAGQKPAYLASQLRAFRAGDRRSDLMRPVAAQLSDGEIQALAAYWGATAPGALPADSPRSSAAIPSRMTFPAMFPDGYTNYLTAEDGGVVSRFYANSAAWNAAKAGRPMPSGAVLIGVDQRVEEDATGRKVVGAVSAYRAMEVRSGWGAGVPALLRNADWDYALFDKTRARRDALNQAQCLACHKARESEDYIFTLKELRKAASGAVVQAP